MGTTLVDAARRALGPVGAILPVSFTRMPPVDLQREAAVRFERAGYRTAWTNEVIGKDALVQLAVLLASTERMVFGTSIANIWAREPQTMNAAAAQLAQAFPGRFVLGLGVGYPQQAASIGRAWDSPLATMRSYRDRMDSPTSPPEFTAQARQLLGPDKLLIVAVSTVIDTARARTPTTAAGRAQLAAGADHVILMGPPGGDFAVGVSQLAGLGPALTDLA